VVFASENWMGRLPAKISDWWFMDFVPSHFKKVDYFGMSYYCRVSHDPWPITYIDTPHKIKSLGKRHDDIWEYYPEGMRECIDRYWRLYRKPIIITESGVCDDSDELRRRAIRDYAVIVHKALGDGVDIKGYFWWSTWDNFEWHLGPSRKFGLYDCDAETKVRRPKASAAIYRSLAYSRELDMGSNNPT
jgi:beta-glucosidase